MGVFLNLSIVPERIPAERWASVYQETLTLLDRFPFLDRVKSENGYFYAARSVHRENVLNDWAGWETEGDMHNGPTNSTAKMRRILLPLFALLAT